MELGAKAVAAAKAVNYVGAGTVEFIMDNVDKKFYFMGMNTRLQVEHPVTEMVTSTDLVEWQLEVASGNPLPATQKELQLEGHAFEARVYAENPANNFLPDIGHLLHLRTPSPSPNVRIETGFEQGDEINVHYDPMIAKLVVKGQNRMEALKILKRALNEYEVVGLNTNIEFLKSVVSHDAFIDGEVETGFITKHNDELFKSKETPSHVIIQASLSLILSELQNITKEIPLGCFKSDFVFKRVLGSWNEAEQQIIVEIENQREGKSILKIPEPSYLEAKLADVAGSIRTPMPCKISLIFVKPGQIVEEGAPLIVLEAMKMEHLIKSPTKGVVEKVLYNGDFIEENKDIINIVVENS